MSILDALFERTAVHQYTRELLFRTLVALMSDVVLGVSRSIRAAYQYADGATMRMRRITVELTKPTRDGESEMHLVTNVPARRHCAITDAVSVARDLSAGKSV